MSHPAGTTVVAKRRFFRTRKAKILIGIIAFLILLRICLPYIVLHYANKTLANMPGYYGHIRDIDISLYRGAYQINDLYLNKQDSATKEQTDFLKIKNMDLSVEWRAIFHERVVGELAVNTPELIFTKDRVELQDVKKDTSDFRKVLKDFMPLKINRFEINNGLLHYTDNTSQPKVDVALRQVHVLAENLSNVADGEKLLPSTVTAQAAAYEGAMDLNLKLNALAEAATFDLNASIKNVNLVKLNDFLKAYGSFDVHRGNFGLYTEMAAKNGAFKGYVKPLITDLDVVGLEDTNDGFFQKIWEHIVGGAGVIFRNQKKDQVATKLSMEGNFKDPKTGTLDAIWEVLRNAFIQALMPSVDNQININSVEKEGEKDDRNLLQRIFGANKKESGKKMED